MFAVPGVRAVTEWAAKRLILSRVSGTGFCCLTGAGSVSVNSGKSLVVQDEPQPHSRASREWP